MDQSHQMSERGNQNIYLGPSNPISVPKVALNFTTTSLSKSSLASATSANHQTCIEKMMPVTSLEI